MIAAVVDASVAVKWFRDEVDSEAARTVLDRHRDRRCVLGAPPIFNIEILNVAGRRWGYPRNGLLDLATTLLNLDIAVVNPDLVLIATWIGRGLTAYDASYVALAQTYNISLITMDREILKVAGHIAVPV